MRSHNAGQARHVVRVARGSPVGTVVKSLPALRQPEGQHCHNVPARVERVRTGMVAFADNLRLVDRLAFSQRVRDEERRPFRGRYVLHPLDPWTLDPKVVRVFNVNLAVGVPANLDVVRTLQ